MPNESTPAAAAPTEVSEPLWGQLLVCAVFGLIGAGACWLAKVLATWVVTLPWAPMQGPAELVASIPEPGLTIGAVAVGGLAGLIGGFLVKLAELSVTVSDTRVVLTRNGEPTEFPRAGVAMAFRDGKQLVLLGHGTEELAREDCDQDRHRLADAFTRHGYTWADEDPHRAEFRLWVPDSPHLPAEAHALFKARRRLLKQRGTAGELRELRRDLERLGLVVRERNGSQYWRRRHR
ncbi:hypothetical protein [Streptomyces sp. C]|uniref:YqeB family protein n=1 Tax=Streptomyces sp. C TaxID=253839 RepID=UPI0001B517DD|nr:hypothetical protein [Streptomyces sp. C]EFL20095.1 conserved hypothetical protein [Streptomyces sp. C]